MSVESSGEWREERLFVLRAIEDLKAEQRRQIEQEAVMRQTVVAKAEKDIRAAHDRLRALEGAKTTLEKSEGIMSIKNWVMAGILSSGFVALIEFVRWMVDRK